MTVTTRDVMTQAEVARVHASTSIEDTPDGVVYTVETPSRLLSVSVIANVTKHGHELLSAVPLDDGFTRCTYRLGVPPSPELLIQVDDKKFAAIATKYEHRFKRGS